MRTRSTRTVDPTVDAVPLAEFKLHLRRAGDDANEDLIRVLRAAVGWVEEYTASSLMGQTWELSIDLDGATLLDDHIDLPRPPLLLSTLESIKYYTAADSEQTFSSNNYWVDKAGHRVVLKSGCSWPSETRAYRSIVVLYQAGYSATDPTKVPGAIRNAVCIVGAHMNEFRTALISGTISKEAELGVRDQLAPYNENLGV